MFSLIATLDATQGFFRSRSAIAAAVALIALFNTIASAKEPVFAVPDSVATTAAEMKPYTDQITNTPVKFKMLPIPGGKFTMGAAASEAGFSADEGPQHEVEIAPFWMGQYELSWDEYEIFMYQLDIEQRKRNSAVETPRDKLADALVRPTKPYTDMTFGMGKEGFPAICMTQHAAKKYCEWISAKTGRYYRLPTEAEWEYACRAGTKTAYSFGDDPAKLDEYAWFLDNADAKTQPIGKKKPNPWGLYDMHGNIAEWCADGYTADFYAKSPAANPLNVPTATEPNVVRGGSWDHDPAKVRSAARVFSDKDWKIQDPQIPQSVWYYTDSQFVGFRLVRPMQEPTDEQKQKYGFEDTSRK